MFTNKKREGIDTFAYAVSLASMSLKHLKPQSRTRISPLPKTPFDIVAYGFFFGTTFLETAVSLPCV